MIKYTVNKEKREVTNCAKMKRIIYFGERVERNVKT